MASISADRVLALVTATLVAFRVSGFLLAMQLGLFDKTDE